MIPNILWKKNEKIYKNGYYECKCKCECDWIVYIFIPNKNPFHIYNISDPISASPARPSTAQPQSLTPPAPATAQLSQARQTPPLQPLTSAHPSTGPSKTQHRPTTAAQPPAARPSSQPHHKYFFNSEWNSIGIWSVLAWLNASLAHAIY